MEEQIMEMTGILRKAMNPPTARLQAAHRLEVHRVRRDPLGRGIPRRNQGRRKLAVLRRTPGGILRSRRQRI